MSNVKKTNSTFGAPYAVLNLSKIGLRYFRMGIKASPASKKRLVALFSNHSNVGWIFDATGYFNLAVGIWAKDNAEINDVSQQIRNGLDPKDEIVFQSELTSLYSFGNRPVTGSGAPMCIVDSTVHPIELTPVEIDYIKLLALDCSLSAGEFAKLLNVSAREIASLHRKLVASGVIVGTQERIEYGKTYFKVFVDTLSRKYTNAEHDLIQMLWSDKACIYLERANSKYDLEFEVILQNKTKLKKYLKHFSNYRIAVLTKNAYTNLYPVNKVANLTEIKHTLLGQSGKLIDFRNSKLWYMGHSGAEAYLNVYAGNKKYFETMEQSELVLFKRIADAVKRRSSNQIFQIVDIGSGDGLKGRAFIQTLGEDRVKAYYPVDIQPIELATALKAHTDGAYAKHPTLLDFERLASRFPLKTLPNEKQVSLFFGGTYGNFDHAKINTSIKPLVRESGMLLVSMPLARRGKTDKEIIESYVSESVDQIVFGPLSQLGFQRSDFEENRKYRGLIAHYAMEDRCLVTSLMLKRDVRIFDHSFKKGTTFKLTTSWKPTLEEFKHALEKDFVIDDMFHNQDMAIALISSVRKGSV